MSKKENKEAMSVTMDRQLVSELRAMAKEQSRSFSAQGRHYCKQGLRHDGAKMREYAARDDVSGAPF